MTKTNSDPIRNLTLSALISSMHRFHYSAWVVLKIWTFEFVICFGFRFSIFMQLREVQRFTAILSNQMTRSVITYLLPQSQSTNQHSQPINYICLQCNFFSPKPQPTYNAQFTAAVFVIPRLLAVISADKNQIQQGGRKQPYGSRDGNGGEIGRIVVIKDRL